MLRFVYIVPCMDIFIFNYDEIYSQVTRGKYGFLVKALKIKDIF